MKTNDSKRYTILDNEKQRGSVQMRVLVVDDEPAFLLGFKKLLQSPDMVIDTTETFEEAISLLDEHNYTAVIADIRLTGVLREEGLDILKYIKEQYPCTKVIMITGYGGTEVMERAMFLGADYYFEKPVPLDMLKNALRDCVLSSTYVQSNAK
jgi:DNA-binding NtrC family response regulator